MAQELNLARLKAIADKYCNKMIRREGLTVFCRLPKNHKGRCKPEHHKEDGRG